MTDTWRIITNFIKKQKTFHFPLWQKLNIYYVRTKKNLKLL